MRTDLRGILGVAATAVLLAGCSVADYYEPLEKIDRTARNVEHTLGSVTRKAPPGQEMMNLPQYVRRFCEGYDGIFKADCIGEALLISETERDNLGAVIYRACAKKTVPLDALIHAYQYGAHTLPKVENSPPRTRLICFDIAVKIADNNVLKKIRQSCNPLSLDFMSVTTDIVLTRLNEKRLTNEKARKSALLIKDDKPGFFLKHEECYSRAIDIMKDGSDPFKPKEEPKKPQESPPVKKQKL